MLTKLLPDQISKFWPIVKYGIEQSLPPVVGDHPDKMSRILSGALSGKIDVWASYNRTGDNAKFDGIMLTQILYDDPSGTKNLLIYCLYGYEKVDKQSWIDGFKSILSYASSKGCMQIVGYTDVPILIDLVKQFGGEAKYTFISFDISSSLNNLTNSLEN